MHFTARAGIELLLPTTDTPYPYHDEHSSWRGWAFGLVVEAHSPLPGLAFARTAEERRVSFELVSAEELETDWPTEEAERLFRQPFPDGRPALTLERYAGLGYRLFAAGYGPWFLSSDGRSIHGGPNGGLEPWLWQRFLIGQVLPFAALLQGLEVFHASGVVLRDSVVAIVGGTGAGKTSVALNLVVRGAGFFTDDVLVLEAGSGRPMCQPGAGAANVRDARLRRIAEDGGRLGEILGRGAESLRILLDREERRLPLGAVYFLDRREEHRGIGFTALTDPYPLLAGTFNFVIRTPARLEAQLDVCARVANWTPIFRVASPLSATAAELAAAVEKHAMAVPAV